MYLPHDNTVKLCKVTFYILTLHSYLVCRADSAELRRGIQGRVG